VTSIKKFRSPASGTLLLLFVFFSTTAIGQNLDSLIGVLPKLPAEERVVVLGELCYYLAPYNSDSAALYGRQGLNLAEKLGDSVLIANAANDYSFVFLNMGDFRGALALNVRAYNIRRANADTMGMLSSLSKMAISHRELGSTDKALQEMFESLTYAKVLEDEGKQAIIYDNIGTLYKMQSLFDKALEYHKLGIDILEQYPPSQQLGNALVNMAALYLKKYEPAKALPYLERAELIFEEFGNKQAIASLYTNFGAAYAGLGNQGKRLYYATKALKAFEELGDVSGISTVHYNLHVYYLEQKSLEQSRYHARKALVYAKQIGGQEVLLDAYKAMSNIFMLYMNSDSSSYYSALADSITSAMGASKLVASLADAETRFETAEKEAEIARKEADLIAAQLEVKTRTVWILALSFLVLVILFATVTLYKQQRLKQERLKAEAKLQEELAKAEMRAKVQEERARISRDLHDHIGTQLTIITASLDNMAFSEENVDKRKHFDAISGQTRETIGQLRETIWAMNNEAVEVEMLVSKLREFCHKIEVLEPAADRKIELVVGDEFHAKLGPAHTIALFRVCQEAVNNALKHAGFTHLQLAFSKGSKGEQLRVEIRDNGKGFDVQQTLKRGFGLRNMQARIEEVEGTFEIDSNQTWGTRIIIELPFSGVQVNTTFDA
jgi:signal transduction histidine kinase